MISNISTSFVNAGQKPVGGQVQFGGFWDAAKSIAKTAKDKAADKYEEIKKGDLPSIGPKKDREEELQAWKTRHKLIDNALHQLKLDVEALKIAVDELETKTGNIAFHRRTAREMEKIDLDAQLDELLPQLAEKKLQLNAKAGRLILKEGPANAELEDLARKIQARELELIIAEAKKGNVNALNKVKNGKVEEPQDALDEL